jgi:hypothetical protein
MIVRSGTRATGVIVVVETAGQQYRQRNGRKIFAHRKSFPDQG